MEKRMRKLPAIVLEDMGMVMEEVTKEVQGLFDRDVTNEERRAVEVFFGTLSSLTLNIFDYLPPEQQDEILTNCGTWFDIGMLLGKSPKLLLETLNKVNPKVEGAEVPDWFAQRIVKGLALEED